MYYQYVNSWGDFYPFFAKSYECDIIYCVSRIGRFYGYRKDTVEYKAD